MPAQGRLDLPRLALTAVAVAALCLLAVEHIPVATVAEHWLGDLRVATLTPATPQSADVLVVAVDEDTLAALPYRSPLDRGLIADLLRSLTDKGVRAIGLDVLLDQPTEPAKDAALFALLEQQRVPVVSAWADAADGMTPRQLTFLRDHLAHLPHGVPGLVVDGLDGTARMLELGRRTPAGLQPGFLSVLAQAAGAEVPDDTTLRIDFRGAPDGATPPFPVYPAHAVSHLPREWFAGRVALVGAVLPLTDRHRTPLTLAAQPGEATTPGIVVLAHGLSQLLESRAARVLSGWQTAVLVLAFAIAGAAGGMARLSLAARITLTLATMAAVVAAAFWLYHASRVLLPLLAPTLALAVAASTVIAIERRREHARGRFIRDAFSRFVAPSVVEELLAHPERLTLTGERRDTSFVFTDLANFTALTERSTPDLVVRLLNEYLDGTCRIVLRHEGTLDKIVGDALHLMFNAPASQPDHPARAVACALDLDRFCQDFATRQRAAGIAFGITRIGVNTGVTVVGNVGGDTRFDYSARGDAINTAARLESLNKHLGTRVCVSGATAERCPGVDFRPVGALVLKGKQQAIAVCEPMAAANGACAPVEEYLQAFGLLDGEPEQARRRFDELSARYPTDCLVAFHAARLARGETGSTIVMRDK